MTFRGGLVGLVLLVAGCAPPLGRVLVTVEFENESQTQCIRASARNASGAAVNATPPTTPRAGKDSLRIGLGETRDLVGEVRVTIARFSTSDCSGTQFASETKNTELVRGADTAMLEFRYTGGPPDGGVDGGTDAGVDAGPGCDVMACGNSPRECERAPATGCQGDGGCRFTFLAARPPCGDGGVCNSMGTCIDDECSVLPAGSACDDQLDCTPSSTCSAGECVGTCSPPQCNTTMLPVMCDSVTPTACRYRPASEYASCVGPTGSQCLDGGCMPWLPYQPPLAQFPTAMRDLPYPTDAWSLSSVDGGFCDTIVSTSGSASTVIQGDCGFPAFGGAITSTVNDAGVAVITTRGLDVGPGARLHFVGARPAQLVVIGDASIRGIVSVAPILGGQQMAGTGPAICNVAGAGTNDRQGGGGGGFGGNGGNGGESGGSGGNATSMVFPLRGGCPGGNGFRRSGGNSPAGTGGGALHLIVANSISMDGGIVTASGGGGTAGLADNEGGGGGGSGGLIILEATSINLANGAVTAYGGGGGEGGSTGTPGVNGSLGPINSGTGAAAANGPSPGGIGGTGGDGSTANGGVGGASSSSNGGGGGGGAVGVVYLRTHGGTCTRGGTAIISGAQPMSVNCAP